jgi:hypothetical protein
MFDLLRLPMLEKMPGARREMRGLRAGSEAQAIATLISIPDQMAMFTPSTVGFVSSSCRERADVENLQDVSVETEISYKLFKRMTLVTQTLPLG